ncbi:MAG: hypothetical protein U0S48_16500 [Solirubrobacteraceae bacterium]
MPLRTWQGEPSRAQLKRETSTSTDGSADRKKCGRSRTSRSGPKIARAKSLGVPWIKPAHDVGVDGQPLDLVELRRVGGVAVAAVDAAGDDHVQRRRLLLHRADLLGEVWVRRTTSVAVCAWTAPSM